MEGKVKKRKAAGEILVVVFTTLILSGLFFGGLFGVLSVYTKNFTGALTNFFGAADQYLCGGIPDGGNSTLHENIHTTNFGGCGDIHAHGGDPKGCGDPGARTCGAAGGIWVGCSAPTPYYAALPYAKIPGQCRGNIDKCARIQVINPKKNISLVLAVVDTGPWNIKDSGYVMGTARPQAETGIDLFGRHTNKAGLDIGPQAMKELGGDDGSEFSWKFTNLPLGTGAVATAGASSATNCGPVVGSGSACASKVIDTAKAELSKTDGSHYGVAPGVAWCAAFASWIYRTLGFLNVIDAAPKSLVEGHSKYLQTITINGGKSGSISQIQPGDIYTSTYKTINKGGSGYHSGIVTSVGADGVIHTIDGNVSHSVGARKRSITDIGWVARPVRCN